MAIVMVRRRRFRNQDRADPERFIDHSTDDYRCDVTGAEQLQVAEQLLQHRREALRQTFGLAFIGLLLYIWLAYSSASQEKKVWRAAGLNWWTARAAWLPQMEPATGYGLLAVIVALFIAMVVGLPRPRTKNETRHLVTEDSNELLRFGGQALAVLATTVSCAIVADVLNAHETVKMSVRRKPEPVILQTAGTPYMVATVTILLVLIFAYAAAIMARSQRQESKRLRRAEMELDLKKMDRWDDQLRRFTGDKIRPRFAVQRPRHVLLVPAAAKTSLLAVAVSCVLLRIEDSRFQVGWVARLAVAIVFLTAAMLRLGAGAVGGLRNRPPDVLMPMFFALLSIVYMTAPFTTRRPPSADPRAAQTFRDTTVELIAVFTVPFAIVHLTLGFGLLLTSRRWAHPQSAVGRWLKTHIPFLMRENRRAYLIAYGLIKAISKSARTGSSNPRYLDEINRTWTMLPLAASSYRKVRARAREEGTT